VIGATTTVLHTTQHHPFWNRTTSEWVNAAELKPGDQLKTDDGATAEVVDVHNFTGAQGMRDLTVADVHTYYVLAGSTPVLVHNTNGCPDGDDPDLFNEFGVTPGQGFNATAPSAGDRSFITYGFFNEAEDITYVGRAQGVGIPDKVLAGRIARGHDHFNSTLTPRVLGVQKTYAANRGAEEFFIQGFLQRGANLTNSDPALGFSKSERGRKSVGYIDAFFDELLG
jgi:hypothetical protein